MPSTVDELVQAFIARSEQSDVPITMTLAEKHQICQALSAQAQVLHQNAAREMAHFGITMPAMLAAMPRKRLWWEDVVIFLRIVVVIVLLFGVAALLDQ